VTASRRELIAAGGCAVVWAIVPGGAVAATGPVLRLVTDDPGLATAGAVLLATGRFIDDGFVAALPSGNYIARLSPANSLLLLEVLRSRRIAAAEDLSFTIGRHT